MVTIPSRSESGSNDLHFDASAHLTADETAKLAAMVRSAAQKLPPPPPPPTAPAGSFISPPPGFAGEVAGFIYNAAPRPVPEVAVVAALGLLAGICGRQWTISGTGLNLYMVLVARSGIGKEAMHLGISKLLEATRLQCREADSFVCFDDFASGPALTKELLNRDCFVNVVGEIGHKFSAMAADKDPSIRTLRRQITNLYAKSGPGTVAGGIAYSNRENNVQLAASVAYSLIGETTPARFYESLTSDMMQDGLLSRFSVLEYLGDRPDKNTQPLTRPDERLAQRLAYMMQHALTLRTNNAFQPVNYGPDAEQLMEDFECECDHSIRAAGDDEAQRQMWNRAHLKTLRLAALLAVADNPFNPVLTFDHGAWAVELTRRDIQVFSKRLQSGEIGDGTDDGRERKLLDLCREYVVMRPEEVPGYGKPFEALRLRGLVPRKYLQIRTQRLASFEKHPRGHKVALDTALQTAVDNGHLAVRDKLKMIEDFGFHGKVYSVMQGEQFRTVVAQDGNWTDRVLKAMNEAKG